jgi:N-acetylmuramoyl-L-alanine amidase
VSYLSLDEGDIERSGARLSGTNPQTVPVLGGGVRSIDVVSWEMAQVSHVDRSGALAAIVDAELRRHVDVRPGEAQRAPFRVLVGANMPAVLVELGFLSNPAEERRLGAPSYQEALSQALFQSIARYRTLVEQRPSSAPEAEEMPRRRP